MVSSDDGDDESVKKTFAKWLFGQEANTIALFCILGGAGYMCYYLVNTGIPKHLEQIHSGYKQINEDDVRARTDDRAFFKETLDRVEKAYQDNRRP